MTIPIQLGLPQLILIIIGLVGLGLLISSVMSLAGRGAGRYRDCRGDEWMLQGDIIKFPTWLNILGLHSGYKLTRLEGRYDDPKLESNSRHVVVTLNGGDDNFFKTMQGQAWVSPVIQAAYGNAVFLM